MKTRLSCRCGAMIVVESDECYRVEQEIDRFRRDHEKCIVSTHPDPDKEEETEPESE